MKEQIIMRNEIMSMESASKCVESVSTWLQKPIVALSNYYSKVLEREVTLSQTHRLVNAQLAFCMAFLPVESPLLLRVACLAWFASAAMKCKKEL